MEVADSKFRYRARKPCGIWAWTSINVAFHRIRVRIYCRADTFWLGGKMARAKQFLIILIKPSHYDDDGYVIQWVRSPIPSNSLASVYSLIDDCRTAESPRRRRRHRDRCHRRDQYRRPLRQAHPPVAGGRLRHGRARRRAVEPVSPRGRYRPKIPRCRHPGGHGRFPCRGQHRHAAEMPAGDRRGAGARHLDLRRRSRGADG